MVMFSISFVNLFSIEEVSLLNLLAIDLKLLNFSDSLKLLISDNNKAVIELHTIFGIFIAFEVKYEELKIVITDEVKMRGTLTNDFNLL